MPDKNDYSHVAELLQYLLGSRWAQYSADESPAHKIKGKSRSFFIEINE
jgi:hypothetical protein